MGLVQATGGGGGEEGGGSRKEVGQKAEAGRGGAECCTPAVGQGRVGSTRADFGPAGGLGLGGERKVFFFVFT